MGKIEMSYKETGILQEIDLIRIFPSKERLCKGPVAIIECLQEIPCDPCMDACKLSAIQKKSLSDPPMVDFSKCIGCGTCVALCPGLAIFIVEHNYTKDKSLLTIPFERLPIPKKGDIFEAVDRSGNKIDNAEIISVNTTKNGTKLVSFIVNKKNSLIIREIGRKIA
jgi:Fe-S-cluster-containing hydrogenase component 2